MSNTDITKIQTTDTFQVWLTRTNDIIDLANENVMLAGPLGFTVEGNSTLTGTFTANTLVADSELIIPIGNTAERPTPLIGSLRFNTQLETFEGYNGQRWGEIGSAGGLGNPIFITSNYTANVNDYVIADSSAASFSIILPPAPQEGDVIRISTTSAKINNIIIAGNGNSFEGAITDLIVNIDFIIIDLIYNSSTWRVFTNFGLGSEGSVNIETDSTSNTNRFITFADRTFGETKDIFVASEKLFFNPLNGELNATSFNSLSDISFKKEIKPIKDALGTVEKLSGVEFLWTLDSRKSAGVIAQQIETIIPHAISENDGTKSVNYNIIIAYLIEAIKELKNRK